MEGRGDSVILLMQVEGGVLKREKLGLRLAKSGTILHMTVVNVISNEDGIH